MSIFDLEPEHPLLPTGREIYRMQGNIELKQAGFSVGPVKLLDRITAKIRPKEQIALVGFSGSGKSTLALLIAQLYSITQGTILLDGKEINTLSKADISRNITMIAQHPFIFTGTIRDNLLYAVRAAAKDENDLPGRDRLLQTIREVGLEEDVLRLGFNMILPQERVMPLREKFLHMRRIIQGELGDQFASLVEFYNPHHFLNYCSLRDNIIFGDSLAGDFDIEKLPGNKVFMDFIRVEKLEQPLLELGLAIARKTVNLLKDIGEDEFFFQGSPMEADQLTVYTELLDELGDRQPPQKQQKDLLLLALRFIPGKHNIVDMRPGLADKIVEARHHFLQNVMGVDINACFESAIQLREKGSLVPLQLFVEQKDFVAFCPTEYLYRHSLKDNILFGGTIKDTQEVDRLYAVAMESFAREGLLDEVLDIGLDFEVGSKGDRLSGGQKQKVAIARALLKDTPILIMDEATASLDNQSQAMIQKLIETRYKDKKTIIAVIHRLDMTPSYDRILVLKAGAMIEQGTYDELMGLKGAFYELVHKH
jgi:putative ABC transport system ATP-binding protein